MSRYQWDLLHINMRDANVDTPLNYRQSVARAGVDGDDDTISIAVMGATGSGKTSFINLASGSTLRVGMGLESCTNVVQIAQPFELDGRRVVLIDTPGFDDTTKSDADVLRMIAAFLATTYENGKTLSGVLYLHRISDFRMGGISTRNFKMFRELCGEDTLKNVIILTNMWGEVSREVGEARESELATRDIFFKPVLDKGAQLRRHTNTIESAHNVLRYLINNHPLSLKIQRELTAAGSELNRELMEQAKKHRQELKQLEEEMKEAIRTKDEETRKELEVETRKLQAEMTRVQEQSKRLASVYSEEKAKLEKCLEDMAEEARVERGKMQAEHEDAKSIDASATERASLMQQVSTLEQSRSRGSGFFPIIGVVLRMVF
ncbi:P-loop containing nucleoside triphosphate hydrolase protein [Infundibulicybe gibba]|nr:P-loop containing nucleoside triphosphate hydrolase protein [Infundibulicybe gibba]